MLRSNTFARRGFRPLLTALEARQLLATSPFDSQFQAAFSKLLSDDNIPQGSVTVIRDGEAFSYGATNAGYFGAGTPPAAPTANSLFRLGSVTKTFTAAAVLKMVQDGKFKLTDSALKLLDYKEGQIVSGHDPVTGAAVSAAIPDALFKISVQNLLQMTSGLIYNIPTASAQFRYSPPGNLTAIQGSYAALGFAGATVPQGGGTATYTAPASMSQLIHYMLFEIGANPSLIAAAPGEMQFYNNMNYGLLGEIVALYSGSNEPTPEARYFEYLNENVLQQLNISVAGGTADAMVGFGATFVGHAYATEVDYYPTTQATSIQPASQPDPAGLPVSSGTVSLPYGGDRDLTTNFANGGLVATPTAVALLMDNLSLAYAGKANIPLTQATVRMMMAPPVAPSTGRAPVGSALNEGQALPVDELAGGGYFGMGVDVFPNAAGGLTWSKDGALAGTSAFTQRFPDGTIYVATFNIDSDAVISDFNALIAQTLFDPPTTVADAASTSLGVPLAIDIAANDTDPNPQGVVVPTQIRFVDLPKHGKVSLDPLNGIVVYVPEPGYTGTDSFSYTIADDYGLRSVPATVTITVQAPAPTLPATAQVAHSDTDGDGVADTIAAVSTNGRPTISIYDGRTGTLRSSVRPYGRGKVRGPLFFSVVDADRDGDPDVVTWLGGRRGIREVRAFDGRTLQRLRIPFRDRQLAEALRQNATRVVHTGDA